MFERFKRWLAAVLSLLVTGRDSLFATRPAACGAVTPPGLVLDGAHEPLYVAPPCVSQILTCVFGFCATIQGRNARHDEMSRRPRASCWGS